MHEFRLTQISDTHLARRLQKLTDNFHRVSEHIDATRPDLVINSGDLAFDAPTSPDDLKFAKELHDALPVPCRHLPGNHDVGDNPTAVGAAPKRPATEPERQKYLSVIGEDRWRFDAAGWCFIGLNALIMNTGIESETGQFDWLTAELGRINGRPVALFLHKPLFLDAPDDAETAETAIRYVPQPRRRELIEMCLRRSICGWWHRATSTNAATLRLATPATSGRLRPASFYPNEFSRSSAQRKSGWWSIASSPTPLRSGTSRRRDKPILIWIH
jgi:3',5'-cyclic AMP phosphodiesterase CpdA